MKVAIIIYNLFFRGGTQRQVFTFARELERRGHTVKIYGMAYDKKECFPEMAEGLSVRALASSIQELAERFPQRKFLGLFSRPSYLISWQWRNRVSRELAKLIDSDTELLNPHGLNSYPTAYYFKKDIKNVPSVYMLNTFPLQSWFLWRRRELDPKFKVSLQKKLFYRLWDMVEAFKFIRPHTISVLDQMNQRYVRKFLYKDSWIARNGVNPERFSYVEKKPPSNKRATILLSGVLYPYRRFEDALEAVKILHDEGYDLSVTHIGGQKTHPEYFEKLVALSKKLGIEKKVKFLGPAEEKRWIRYYQEHDISVFPNIHQPGHMAVFESLACGTPAIVSRGSAAHEILTHKENALLVNPKSPQEIAANLRLLIDDPNLYIKLSRNGRKFVEENVTWGHFIDSVLGIFDQAMAASQTRFRRIGNSVWGGAQKLIVSNSAINLKIVAFIGARSGSKNIPHKNVRDLLGKPMMAYIIEAAKKAKLVNRVIVSTDSEEYAKIAREFGAETPFLRPKEISGDKATDIEYINHALDWLEKNEGYRPDMVLRLVPTAPLQRSEDIDATIEALLKDPEADSAMGVAEAQQHPNKALKITEDGKYLIPYLGGTFSSAPILRQNFEKAYFRGNIIATRYKTIKEKSSLFGERSAYHIIPAEYAVDVDSELDFILAEALEASKL